MGKDKLTTLDDFNVNALAEIQGKKELQLQLVKDNPFVEITDNPSWEVAKKSRTILRTGRTDLEKEKKSVLSKIKEVITEPVSKTYDSFIAISQPHEEKQQAEVKRYEDIKENERLERERLDEERKQLHRNNIETFFNINKGAIENLTFETAKTFSLEPKVNGEVVTSEIFEEFQDMFDGKLEVLKMQLNEKRTILQEKEDIRLQQEKIAAAQKEQERVEGIKKSIDTFYIRWSNGISQLTFGNIKDFKKLFDEDKGIDCQELQPLFAEKRAELVKAIETRVNFLQDNEQLRIDREAVAKQKQENLIASRTNELMSLGFDKDGAYDTPQFKMIVSEDDLLCEESEWRLLIFEAKDSIRIANIPVVVEETVEEILNTEPETVSTEVDAVNTEVPENTIMKVDYEENLSQPTEAELNKLISDYLLSLDYNGLLEACIRLGLIAEKE